MLNFETYQLNVHMTMAYEYIISWKVKGKDKVVPVLN
jgi:hypothetical protein